MLANRLDQADCLKRAQAFVVHADPAGIVDQRITALDDQGADAVAAEKIRKRQADGTGADNGDVDGARTVPGFDRILRFGGQRNPSLTNKRTIAARAPRRSNCHGLRTLCTPRRRLARRSHDAQRP